MAPVPGLRNKGVCLMCQWVLTMEVKCASSWADTCNLSSKKYNKNGSGLYLHDGLAVLKIQSRPQSEQVKKNIQKISNLKSVNVCIDIFFFLYVGVAVIRVCWPKKL